MGGFKLRLHREGEGSPAVIRAQFPEAVQAVGQGPYRAIMQMTFLVFALGYVLFGVATLRAGTFPKWAAWLVIVGALLANAGIVWMGWTLWSGKPAAMTAQPRPAM